MEGRTLPKPHLPDRSDRPAAARQLVDILLAVLVLMVVVLVVVYGARHSGYRFHWFRLAEHAPLLLRGLVMTIEISVVSLPLAFVLGLATAGARRSRSIMARLIARGYLETIRNTPLLIQILFVFAVLRPLFALPDLVAGVLALSLFEGAYASEMFRAGLEAIPRGQREAAASLGLTRWQAFRHVVFPQVIRRMLPALVGQAVSLVKDSSLLSAVSIAELTLRARRLDSDTFLSLEIWLTVAALYLVVTLVLSGTARLLERRLQRRTGEGAAA